jgi:hypothetical protein
VLALSEREPRALARASSTVIAPRAHKRNTPRARASVYLRGAVARPRRKSAPKAGINLSSDVYSPGRVNSCGLPRCAVTGEALKR